MISTPVRVVAVQGRVAQVEAAAQSGCGGCAAREACGVSGLGKYFSARRKAIALPCDGTLRAGDEVVVRMDEGDLIKAGLLAYLLPTVLAVIGAALLAAQGDAAAVLGAAAGAVTGLLLARWSGWTPPVVIQTDTNQGEGNE